MNNTASGETDYKDWFLSYTVLKNTQIMGLDTVLLIVSVEEEFGITIPNQEAAKITTVQQLADYLHKSIKLNTGEKCISQSIFYQLRKALQSLGAERKTIHPKSKLSDFLTNAHQWNQLGKTLGLSLPKLKFFGEKPAFIINTLNFFKSQKLTAEHSLRIFTDWTISLNYNQLLDCQEISSKYEIERVLCGILNKEMGIPIQEIQLHHSFTNDLGMD